MIDPCAGSGTTLRAAYELGRNSYGFEISREFYGKAKDKCLETCKFREDFCCSRTVDEDAGNHTAHPVTAKDYGFNAVYAGKHWAKRNADAARVSMRKCGRSYLRRKSPEAHERPGHTGILLQFFASDCSNHGYLTKLIEDGLKGWVIEDDDRRHVKGIYQGFSI